MKRSWPNANKTFLLRPVVHVRKKQAKYSHLSRSVHIYFPNTLVSHNPQYCPLLLPLYRGLFSQCGFPLSLDARLVYVLRICVPIGRTLSPNNLYVAISHPIVMLYWDDRCWFSNNLASLLVMGAINRLVKPYNIRLVSYYYINFSMFSLYKLHMYLIIYVWINNSYIKIYYSTKFPYFLQLSTV